MSQAVIINHIDTKLSDWMMFFDRSARVVHLGSGNIRILAKSEEKIK